MLNRVNHLTTTSSPLPRRLLPVTILFSRRWWWSTLLVLAAVAVMVRLGFWQLDRLAQRRARNAEIAHQLALPPLDLTGEVSLPDDLTTLKIRRGIAQGEFDFERQLALKHQNWGGSPGIHLITPLVIEGGSQAILVDRGWIPQAEAAPERWAQFDEPGTATVTGFIRLSQTIAQTEPQADQPASRPASGDQTAQSEWYRLDISTIQGQLPYELLPIYLEQTPSTAGETDLPYRREPEFDLSDGSHLGYAIQWYIFALILGIGYLNYVSKEAKKASMEIIGKKEQGGSN